METILKDGFNEFGIQSDERIMSYFKKYMSELISWNNKINITSITDEKEIVLKHFLDSLSSSKFIPFKNQKILDMGTGAGFPGLPLKIIFPDLDITFLDSSNKKMNVLRAICISLGIEKYEIIADNIEKLARDLDYREKYDIVTCRALSSLNSLIEYGIPFLKEKGVLVIYKGPNIEEEVDNSINALDKLHAKILEKHEIILPLSDYRRTILVVEKVWKTPEEYPRKIGIPKKRPL
jgi:16S rRNA (guanine527-N7)-methyltransferase